MKIKTFQYILFLLIFTSSTAFAVPPECKKPNAPPRCFNKVTTVKIDVINAEVNEIKKGTTDFSAEDWNKASMLADLITEIEQPTSKKNKQSKSKTCAYLCSKSKQMCEPTDLSPCHGTGGTCKKYCW